MIKKRRMITTIFYIESMVMFVIFNITSFIMVNKKMKKTSKGFFYRFPRIAGIAVIVFISMFALDVFWQGYTFRQTVVALFMHLIPSIILTIGLIIGRKYDLVGALVFLATGLLYIVSTSWNQMDRNTKISWLLIIALPMIVVGICFLVRRLHIRKK